MLTIFGGQVPDLTVILNEERFPESWEPRILSRYGLTMAKFNGTILKVARGVNTKVEKAETDGKAPKPDGVDPMAAPATA